MKLNEEWEADYEVVIRVIIRVLQGERLKYGHHDLGESRQSYTGRRTNSSCLNGSFCESNLPACAETAGSPIHAPPRQETRGRSTSVTLLGIRVCSSSCVRVTPVLAKDM